MFGCCASRRQRDSPECTTRPSFKEKQDRKTRTAVKKFNEGHTKEALEDLGLQDDRATAGWLHHTYGLDQTLLGDVLGDPKHGQLMTAYVTKLAFRGLTLDKALRDLLKGFRLPGEAQKIDRIMDCFAKHWCSQQPTGQTALRPDDAYIVSFALIMLNTDLHNPSVKRKMTQADFQNSLRGVANGEDLPAAWLAALYKGIKDKEICLKGKITERRRPAAIVSDLDQESLKKLRLRARFQGAVRVVTTVLSMTGGEAARNPDFHPCPLIVVSGPPSRKTTEADEIYYEESFGLRALHAEEELPSGCTIERSYDGSEISI